ncbi:MAG: tRNA glutamyl-Q(34) synthetase GluQRS [Thiogranum sp.]
MTSETTVRYRGRFAPSPTGPLHFGSLVAAVGSFLDARAHGGEWLVRIEDIDPPREVAGATDDILRTLDSFALFSDGETLYQSRRTAHYEHALEQLTAAGSVFPCACSRRDIRESSNSNPHIYPGTCRNGVPPGRTARSLRLRVPDTSIGFLDRLQGNIHEWLPGCCGDFVLKRADGWFAYQLAVVTDDAAQGITHVVRGADLLDSTPRQILLQRLLGVPTPRYLHLPVAVNRAGEKLSKQTGAPAVDTARPVRTLCAVLDFLGLQTPRALEQEDLDAFWQWAITNWDARRLRTTKFIKHD